MELRAQYTDNGVSFSPPAYVQRYGAVCDLIKGDPRWSGTIQKVVDFGCAELSLFYYLKSVAGITSILEVDYDGELLKRFHNRAEPLFYDHLFQRETPLSVSVLKGSVSDPDYRLIGCDAVIAIELIEHLDGGVFDRLPHNIFGYIKPRLAIVTTPNADFNVLFPNLKNGGYRHYDHRFEWTREQFQDWANNVVSLYSDYEVEVSGLAPGPEGTEHLGCCSQMAVFINNYFTKREDVNASDLERDLSGVDGAGEKIGLQPSGGGLLHRSDCDPPPASAGQPLSPDCEVKVEVSPPHSVTSEDPLDENENQGRLDYKDLVVEREHQHQTNPTSPADVPETLWDCRPWENEAVTKYYTSIAEYQYPFFVDPRSREQKIVDHVKYKVSSYCDYEHQHYDTEHDLWRIPLPYLLSLCHEFADLDVDELRTIMYNAGYEVDTENLVYRITYEESSCHSEVGPYDDSYQGDVLQDNYDHQETWDFSCPNEPNAWTCDSREAEEGWSTQQSPYTPYTTEMHNKQNATLQMQKMTQNNTADGYPSEQTTTTDYSEDDKIQHRETNTLYLNEKQTQQYQENVSSVLSDSIATIVSQETFTDSNETLMTVAEDACYVSDADYRKKSKTLSNEKDQTPSIVIDNKNESVCTTIKSQNSYIVNSSVSTMCSNSSSARETSEVVIENKQASETSGESFVSRGVSISNESSTGTVTREMQSSIFRESDCLMAGEDVDSFLTIDSQDSFTDSNNTQTTILSDEEKFLVDNVKQHTSPSDRTLNNDDSKQTNGGKQLTVEYSKEVDSDKQTTKKLNGENMKQVNSEKKLNIQESKQMNTNKQLDIEDSKQMNIDKQLNDEDLKQIDDEDDASKQMHEEEQLNVDLTSEQLDTSLAGRLEDNCSLSCTDERSPSSPLAQFCNASKDKDGTEMLSDSGYLKSQDSPQSPICSDSFSNDLITPDKDVSEMVQSTILECIPENLNYVTQTSSTCSPKGSGNVKNSSLRRKSLGPMTTTSDTTNEDEFSGCTSMSRPKSLHVCTTMNDDVDHGDFKSSSADRFRAVLYESPTNAVPRQQFSSPRNELSNRPAHRMFRQMNEYEDEEDDLVGQGRGRGHLRPEQNNRPNFLDLQNLDVAVLDHQNNNVDFEGNNIDEDERIGANAVQDVELDAADLMRQHMDIHNENHMVVGGGILPPLQQQQAAAAAAAEDEEEMVGEIVEEYREPCQGDNYGCNPKIPPLKKTSAQKLSSVTTSSSHNVASTSPCCRHYPISSRIATSQDEEHDADLLIDSIQKTLSLQSNDSIFLEDENDHQSPCCSKTFYNYYGDDKNIINEPSTSTKDDNNFYYLERKKTGHCLTTMLYSNQKGLNRNSYTASDLSFNNELNATNSMTNFYKNSSDLSFSDNSSGDISKNPSDLNVIESKDLYSGLEGCLTIIGSHLNKCFASSTFLDWNDKEQTVKLSDNDKDIVDLDVRRDIASYASEENLFDGDVVESPIVPTLEKKSSEFLKGVVNLEVIRQESTGPPSTSTSSSDLEQFFSLEEQLILPDWFVQIMSNNPEFDEEMMSAAAMVFAPVERRAGGDGVGVHSQPSTHSSGHATMSSTPSHTNQSVIAPIDRQAYSFMDIPYFQPPSRDNNQYETSSSNSSIDLQLPCELVQDSRLNACQCDYCRTNNSDNVSHHNYYTHTIEDGNTTTADKLNYHHYNLANALQLQQENMQQDSSDDTYQSHSYCINDTSSQITEMEVVNHPCCFSPENNHTQRDSVKISDRDFEQPNSLIDLPEDNLTFRDVDSFNDYEDAKSSVVGSCEFLKNSISFTSHINSKDNVSLRGVPSDMSGNYADVETDLDSEAD